MSGWRTDDSRAECWTCGWQPEERGSARYEAGAAVAHKRELPDHDVAITREQSRLVQVTPKSEGGNG